MRHIGVMLVLVILGGCAAIPAGTPVPRGDIVSKVPTAVYVAPTATAVPVPTETPTPPAQRGDRVETIGDSLSTLMIRGLTARLPPVGAFTPAEYRQVEDGISVMAEQGRQQFFGLARQVETTCSFTDQQAASELSTLAVSVNTGQGVYDFRLINPRITGALLLHGQGQETCADAFAAVSSMAAQGR